MRLQAVRLDKDGPPQERPYSARTWKCELRRTVSTEHCDFIVFQYQISV